MLIKTMNYTFMLLAMSFNFWFILSIVNGHVWSEMFFSYLSDKDYITKVKRNLESGKICKDNLVKK